MMSIKTVNALSHYTDWTIGHVHSGALGWVAFISIGCVYYLIPRMFGKTEMWSTRLITAHFWIATIGVVLYIAAMWIAGVMQGLMWRATNPDGTLTYTFVESVKATYPFYMIRLVGGLMFLTGMLIMAWNVIKTVNALSHYTDWTVGHVHSGALGWVAFISIGSIYYLIPRLFGREQMHSVKLMTVHFWIATIGVVLYIASMWIAGVMQGLMWRATNPDGTLTYAFVEAVKATYPYWTIRLLGGLMFLAGMLIMAWNTWKTIAGAKAYDAPVLAPAGQHA